MFVPYAYVSIKSIDCFILLSLALNEILLTSLVNTSSFLLLNHYYDFDVIFVMYFLWIFGGLSTLRLVELLLNNVYNLQN